MSHKGTQKIRQEGVKILLLRPFWRKLLRVSLALAWCLSEAILPAQTIQFNLTTANQHKWTLSDREAQQSPVSNHRMDDDDHLGPASSGRSSNQSDWLQARRSQGETVFQEEAPNKGQPETPHLAQSESILRPHVAVSIYTTIGGQSAANESSSGGHSMQEGAPQKRHNKQSSRPLDEPHSISGEPVGQPAHKQAQFATLVATHDGRAGSESTGNQRLRQAAENHWRYETATEGERAEESSTGDERPRGRGAGLRAASGGDGNVAPDGLADPQSAQGQSTFTLSGPMINAVITLPDPSAQAPQRTHGEQEGARQQGGSDKDSSDSGNGINNNINNNIINNDSGADDGDREKNYRHGKRAKKQQLTEDDLDYEPADEEPTAAGSSSSASRRHRTLESRLLDGAHLGSGDDIGDNFEFSIGLDGEETLINPTSGGSSKLTPHNLAQSKQRSHNGNNAHDKPRTTDDESDIFRGSISNRRFISSNLPLDLLGTGGGSLSLKRHKAFKSVPRGGSNDIGEEDEQSVSETTDDQTIDEHGQPAGLAGSLLSGHHYREDGAKGEKYLPNKWGSSGGGLSQADSRSEKQLGRRRAGSQGDDPQEGQDRREAVNKGGSKPKNSWTGGDKGRGLETGVSESAPTDDGDDDTMENLLLSSSDEFGDSLSSLFGVDFRPSKTRRSLSANLASSKGAEESETTEDEVGRDVQTRDLSVDPTRTTLTRRSKMRTNLDQAKGSTPSNSRRVNKVDRGKSMSSASKQPTVILRGDDAKRFEQLLQNLKSLSSLNLGASETSAQKSTRGRLAVATSLARAHGQSDQRRPARAQRKQEDEKQAGSKWRAGVDGGNTARRSKDALDSLEKRLSDCEQRAAAAASKRRELSVPSKQTDSSNHSDDDDEGDNQRRASSTNEESSTNETPVDADPDSSPSSQSDASDDLNDTDGSNKIERSHIAGLRASSPVSFARNQQSNRPEIQAAGSNRSEDSGHEQLSMRLGTGEGRQKTVGPPNEDDDDLATSMDTSIAQREGETNEDGEPQSEGDGNMGGKLVVQQQQLDPSAKIEQLNRQNTLDLTKQRKDTSNDKQHSPNSYIDYDKLDDREVYRASSSERVGVSTSTPTSTSSDGRAEATRKESTKSGGSQIDDKSISKLRSLREALERVSLEMAKQDTATKPYEKSSSVKVIES